MQLPAHIAERIRTWITNTPKGSFDVDHEAARYGGISLMGTIGATWLLRPDGTFWDVDDDSGKPLQPLPAELHVTALVAGTERHHWLNELLPVRPSNAVDCGPCNGRGRVFVGADPEHFVYCPRCSALGWSTPPH